MESTVETDYLEEDKNEEYRDPYLAADDTKSEYNGENYKLQAHPNPSDQEGSLP